MNKTHPSMPGDLSQDQQMTHISVVESNNVTFNQTQIIQISATEVKTRQLIKSSPFMGLKQFDIDHKDIFFGRDSFIDRLVSELEQTNLVLLFGASGSGKSSIIRAGVIPFLSKKWGENFSSLSFNPDCNPFESFYASLLNNGYKQSESQIARECSSETLVQVVNILKPSEKYWLIFIDQFEELFTTSLDSNRNVFIKSLLKLISKKDTLVKVIATIRADFMHKLSPYNALEKVTDKHRPMITEMQPDELRQAIEQPAAQHGVVFETGLVEQIIQEVHGRAGYLPLLQYTLDLLWKRELEKTDLCNRTLHTETYRSIGGVRGALEKQIKLYYERLSKQEQVIVQGIFMKLVGIGGNERSEEDWIAVRRRTSRSEFNEETLEGEILSQLINEKLLVSQESTIELAHEILLTSWPLNTWISDNRKAIAIRNRLNNDVSLWKTNRSEAELWNGSKLTQVLELKGDAIFNNVLGGFNKDGNEFIEASIKLRDRQKKRVIIALVIFFLTVIISIGNTLQQRQRSIQRATAVALQKYDQTTLDGLEELKDNADRLKRIKNLEKDEQSQRELFSYYRTILQNAYLLNEFILNNQDNPFIPRDLETIDRLYKSTETDLSDLVTQYRLPQLETYLKAGQFGNLRRDILPKITDFAKQYEPQTALQYTYIILMVSPTEGGDGLNFGIGADLDRNGLIESTKEAEMIPCKTLQEIQELWRMYTENKCDWNGDDFFSDQDCNAVKPYSLSSIVFDSSSIAKAIAPRLRKCGLVPEDLKTP